MTDKTIEEEKKLVAEKLMELAVWVDKEGETSFPSGAYKKGSEPVFMGELVYQFKNWNPQSDRNCWPEIWEKMGTEQRLLFVGEIMKLLCTELTDIHWDTVDMWRIHTAPPDICWKALIKTLEAP